MKRKRDLIDLLPNIKSVGLEIEGGYCPSDLRTLISKYGRGFHFDVGRDGSVEVEDDCHICGDSLVDDGEIRLWVEKKRLPSLFTFLREAFDNGIITQNSSCGNHVHIKFVDMRLADVFASEEAWTIFRDSYCETFPTNSKFTRRLLSRFCGGSLTDEELGLLRTKRYNNMGRYKMINFYSLLESQATLEFRILPFFSDSKEAIKSYESLLLIIEKVTENRTLLKVAGLIK